MTKNQKLYPTRPKWNVSLTQFSLNWIHKTPEATPMPGIMNVKQRKESWQAKRKQVFKVKISYFCEFYRNLWPCEYISKASPRAVEGTYVDQMTGLKLKLHYLQGKSTCGLRSIY